MRLNSVGQGSSVFQLLIAAVVALAILGVLLQVLNIINPDVGAEPSKVAVDRLKDAYGQPGTLKTSAKVTFRASTDPLNAGGIAKSSGVTSPQNVCISVGDFEGTEKFNTEVSGKTIKYKGNGSQPAQISVLCDHSAEIEQTLDDYGAGYSDWLQGCEFESNLNETVCIIALRVAK